MAEQLLSGNVRVVDNQGGVRYILPRRPSVGGLLHLPFFLGVVFTLVGTAVILMTDVYPTHSDPWVGRLFGYGFGSGGLVAWTLGSFLSFGHLEFELASGRLRVLSRAGPLRWSRSYSSEGLRIVSAIHTPGQVNGCPMTGHGESWPCSAPRGRAADLDPWPPLIRCPG